MRSVASTPTCRQAKPIRRRTWWAESEWCGYRFYCPTTGRFLTRDPIGYDGGINLYAYCEDNPVNNSDPSGLDWTPWEAGVLVFDTLVIGYDKWQGASPQELAIDGAALGYDAAAALVPFLPAGGGRALALASAGGRVVHAVEAVNHAATVVRGTAGAGAIANGLVRLAAKRSGPTSGNNQAANKGQQAHSDFRAKAQQKGWLTEQTIVDRATGKKYRVDAITKKGRIIELKPNTTRGIQRGKAQIEKYKQILGVHGRVVYYDP